VEKRTVLRAPTSAAGLPPEGAFVFAPQYNPANSTVASAGRARSARLESNVDGSESTSM
jgi:hypothetical protein